MTDKTASDLADRFEAWGATSDRLVMANTKRNVAADLGEFCLAHLPEILSTLRRVEPSSDQPRPSVFEDQCSDQPPPTVATGHPEQGALLSGWLAKLAAAVDGFDEYGHLLYSRGRDEHGREVPPPRGEYPTNFYVIPPHPTKHTGGMSFGELRQIARALSDGAAIASTRDEARERLSAALAMADRYGIGGVQFGEGPDGEVNFDDVRALLSDQPRPSVSEDQEASRDHALSGGSALDGWQPIETAPRDGTPILGWSDEGVSYVCWPYRRTNAHGDWCFFTSGRGEELGFFPTHWMPLPAPPSSATQTVEAVPGTNPKTPDKGGK